MSHPLPGTAIGLSESLVELAKLLDDQFEPKDGSDVFTANHVELHISVPLSMTDRHKIEMRNEALKTRFDQSVTIVPQVEAMAAPRLKMAFDRKDIRKGDRVLFLFCDASNEGEVYSISNPKFNFSECESMTMHSGWDAVELGFRDWMKDTFGSSFSLLDPQVTDTQSDFINVFKDLYLGDIHDDDVRSVPIKMDHAFINEDYYELHSDSVLIQKSVFCALFLLLCFRNSR